MRLREIEDTDSLLLMAYIYHLYMGLLSGGIILRKKKQLVQKINPFKDTAVNEGNCLTDFGKYNIYDMKRELRNTMNKIADMLDEDTKNKLLEESKTVYTLNNEIIRSVRGAGSVIVKKLVYILIVLVFVISCIFHLFRQ
jgi:heme oxygenase